MRYALLIWGVLTGLYGLLALANAAGAIHEIEAGVAFTIATVSIGLAGVIEAVETAGRQPVAAPQPTAAPASWREIP